MGNVRRIGGAAALAAALAAAACTAPRPPLVVTDPDPSVKIPAYKKAVRENDKDDLPQIVADLESDDPAVRFYAIETLERLTGQTLSYVYYADEEQRRPAVERANSSKMAAALGKLMSREKPMAWAICCTHHQSGRASPGG